MSHDLLSHYHFLLLLGIDVSFNFYFHDVRGGIYSSATSPRPHFLFFEFAWGMAGPMSRRWCCTVFVQNFEEWVPADKLTAGNGVEFACWGLEECPETGRWHWHVYARFNCRKRMETVKRVLGREDAHCEIANGNEAQCREYCWKTTEKNGAPANQESHGSIGTFDEKNGKQGRRSDLEEVAAMVDKGDSDMAVAQAHPADFIRYHGGIAAYRIAVVNPPAVREVEVLWFWGPTGTGKTHRVLTTFPDCYSVTPGRSPWDGYTNQTTILFDEFTGEANWPLDSMKRLLDKWRMSLDARYNNKFAAWTRVVICSNSVPTSFYSTVRGPDWAAWARRIKMGCRLVETREDAGGPTFEELRAEPPNPSENSW